MGALKSQEGRSLPQLEGSSGIVHGSWTGNPSLTGTSLVLAYAFYAEGALPLARCFACNPRFYNTYPCIIITAKGQPDVATR